MSENDRQLNHLDSEFLDSKKCITEFILINFIMIGNKKTRIVIKVIGVWGTEIIY